MNKQEKIMNDNFITYLAKNESTFLCTFVLDSPNELEVFVEDRKVFYSQDYTINNFGLPSQQVEFFNLIGTIISPQIIVLKRCPVVARKTSFANTSQLRAEVLNEEFDNIISTQQFLKDNVQRATKISSYNNDEIFLPPPKSNKALVWNDNNLVNSQNNLDESLDALLSFMDNAQIGVLNPDLSNYYTKDQVYTKADVYTKNEVDDKMVSQQELINQHLHTILLSQIGDIKVNILGKYQDVTLWNDGVFAYLLCNGQSVNKADYPELATVLGTNTDTFIIPDFKDGTLRNLPMGNTRDLGSFQNFATEKFKGDTTFGFKDNEGNIHGFELPVYDQNKPMTLGKVNQNGLSYVSYFYEEGYRYSQATNINYNICNVLLDNSLVQTTDTETRMKNIGVQFYIKAKLLIN